MNSPHLQDMVDIQAIPEWVAEILDGLSTEEKKALATDQLKGTVKEAVVGLCERIEHPEGKMLYPSSALIAPSDGIVTAIREDLLDRYFPGTGRVGSLIRHHISQGWDSGQKKTALKWFAVMAVAWFLWSPILWVLRSPLRWYRHRYMSEVRSEFRNLHTSQGSAQTQPEPLPQARVPSPTPQSSVVSAQPTKMTEIPETPQVSAACQ